MKDGLLDGIHRGLIKANSKVGGHIKPDPYNFISILAAEYGVEAASEVAAFEAKHVHAMKDFVDKEKIDCNYTVTKAIDVQISPDHFAKLKGGYESLISKECDPTKQARFVGTEDAELVSISS